MVLLLDTNAAIWFLTNDGQLGPRALRDIASGSNRVYCSDVVLLECAIKIKTGKLTADIDFKLLDRTLAANFIQQISFDGWSAQDRRPMDGHA